MNDKKVSIQTKIAILSVSALSFFGILVSDSLNVVLPLLTKEFSISLGTSQLVTSGYFLVTTIVMSTSGFLMKKFKSRSLFIIAVLLNVVGAILCIMSPNFSILLVGRLLQAAGTGIATPLMYHVIMSLIPRHRLGLYMGIAGMIISLAPVLGPTYGGSLSAFWSWRWIFIITIPFLLIIAWIGAKNIHVDPTGTKQKFDVIGLLLLGIIFVSLSVAFTNAGTYGFSGRTFICLLGIFVLGLFLLIFYYHFSKERILNFRLLLNPILGLRWINYCILQFVNIGIALVVPIFAEDYLHTTSFISGLILLPGALLGSIFTPVARHVLDRHGAFPPLLASSIAILLGSCMFFFTSTALTIWTTGLAYLVLRIGFNIGFSNSLADASLQASLTEKENVNSLFNTFQQYSGALGTSVLSAIISAKQIEKGNSLPTLTMQGSKIDFIILIFLSLISLGSVLTAQFIKAKTTPNK